MKKKYTPFLLYIIMFLFSVNLVAQNNTLWTEIKKEKASSGELHFRKTEPNKSVFYNLNLENLKLVLRNAPKRENLQNESNLLINFPSPSGKLESFKVMEASVMEDELQTLYPKFRSYAAQSVDNPGTIIRFSITNKGLHSMGFSSKKGTSFIDPYSKSGNNYIVYNKKDLPKYDSGVECHYVNSEEDNERLSNISSSRINADDGLMRNYRLAVATTIEYSQFHWLAAGLNAGSTLAAKKDAVMDAIVVTITRNNFVYEKDLSITMTLVGNNSEVIFIDSDNFNNDVATVLIDQSQTEIDRVIGTANYDVGHTFSTGGGGLAQLGSPCGSGKARGITGGPAPVGDSYDIDFVAHELGHQFGAPHTWNGTEGNCTAGARGDDDAYEVGSGTTIMAYAGICGSDNVEGNSDVYFHQKSLDRIFTFAKGARGAGGICSDNTDTFNGVPVATVTNPAVNIPISTPYKLMGSSTDPDGIATHTYTWEQYDLGAAGLPLETNTVGPMVRSFEGTNNPTRFIPNLADLLTSNGGSTDWEKLPSVNRSQNFRLTVRDNDVRGGQTAVAPMFVSFNATAGPFLVTSQNTVSLVWTPGNTETITWDVNNTAAGSAGSANVNILLSTDGGVTYATTLVSNVPNDGSQDIVVPTVEAANCRIMVEAASNVFFNINTKNIAIGNYTYVLQPETCTVYPFNAGIPVVEDGGSYTGYNLNIPDSVTISDVNINVNITTANNADIWYAVRGPWQPTGLQQLASGICTGTANTDLTFDDEGAAVNCASTNNGDNILPQIALSFADGQNSAGNWSFFLTDINVDGTISTWNSTTITICEQETLPILATESFNLEDSLGIYPNPNNGEFTVNVKSTQSKEIAITVNDMRGRKVYNKAFKANGSLNQKINLGQVQSGIYLVNVNDGANQITKKILVN